MRWALVILILYILPLWTLFKYRRDFKRASIYGSIYIVVASVIVISNIYISTLNKMEDMLDYKAYALDEKYINLSKKKNPKKSNENKSKVNKEILEEDIEDKKINKDYNKSKNAKPKEKSDKEIINKFKENIYSIERKALVPMRECMPDMKHLKINSETIKNAKKDVSYAKDMCEEVVKTYEDMKVPSLSNDKDTKKLAQSKMYVQKAYILRGKAMDSAQSLLKSKNLKYVGEIKEYLRLSDIEIKRFVDTIKEI